MDAFGLDSVSWDAFGLDSVLIVEASHSYADTS